MKKTTNKIERQPTELEEIFANDMSDKGLITKIPDVKNWLIGKDPDAGKDWRQEEKGTTEDEMVGWHPESPRACLSSCSLHCWCHPTISSSDTLFSLCPQSFPASGAIQQIVYSHQMTKYWSFSFSISPSSEYSGLLSLKIDWFDLLGVQQGTFRSLLQHHSSKAPILWHSAFFMVQLS